MKYFSSLITCILWLFSISVSNAQTGWQWATANQLFPAAGGGMECVPSAIDPSGNVFFACQALIVDSTKYGPFTIYNPSDEKQMIIGKVDPSGNFAWVMGTQFSDVKPISITCDESGNLFLLGSYDSSTCDIGGVILSNPSYNITPMIFTAKISSTGTVLFAANIIRSFHTSGGLMLDGLGNAYISGEFANRTQPVGASVLVNRDTSGLTTDAFLIKLDSSGNIGWVKSFGGPHFELYDKVAVSRSGNIYISGATLSDSIDVGSTTLHDSSYGFRHYLLKFDSDGHNIWAESTPRLNVACMQVDSLEHIYMTGYIDTNVILGPDTLINHGLESYFLVKYDSSGHVIWARTAAGTARDKGITIGFDVCGSVWVFGGMAGSGFTGYMLDFDGHTVFHPLIIGDPAFLVSYDVAGNFLSGISLRSGGEDGSGGIVFDSHSNLYIVGDYAFDMVIGPDTLYTTAAAEALFIAKYTYDTAGCAMYTLPATSLKKITQDIILFPNPAGNEFTIQTSDDFLPRSKAELYDLTGRLINTYPLSGHNTVVSVAGLSPGIYHCRVINGDDVVIRKLAVMK